MKHLENANAGAHPNKIHRLDDRKTKKIRLPSQLENSCNRKSNSRCKCLRKREEGICNNGIFCCQRRNNWSRGTKLQRLWICSLFLCCLLVASMLTWAYRHRLTIDSARHSLLEYPSTPLITKDSSDTASSRRACVDATNGENCTNDSREKLCQLSENFTDCDNDCRRLRCQLMRWPESKPKAFIYYLIQYERLDKMLKSLALLDKHFNAKHQYPVVVFQEAGEDFEVARAFLRSWTKSTIHFQTVRFQLPDFIPHNFTERTKITCRRSVGYKHMCRFHAKLFYEHPIIRGFEYAWRLDDDSEIMSTIEYDVFAYMQNHNLQYGYTIVDFERRDCAVGLWESAESYISNNSINSTFFSEWERYTIFYNNFEISRLSLWLSNDYQKYVDYIDGLGGIYYYRWGDAPIKTIAISMFVLRNDTHHFEDIRYVHQQLKN